VRARVHGGCERMAVDLASIFLKKGRKRRKKKEGKERRKVEKVKEMREASPSCLCREGGERRV
jgi:hypothetical protein